MSGATKWLRIVLGVGAVYHILLGLALILFKSHVAEMARLFFRFNLAPTPEIMWIANPFAAYMLAFGLMLGVTASDPARYRPMVFVAVVLFALRGIQRMMFLACGDSALKALANPTQNIVHLAVVAAMCMAMVALAMKLRPAAD